MPYSIQNGAWWSVRGLFRPCLGRVPLFQVLWGGPGISNLLISGEGYIRRLLRDREGLL